MSHQEINLNYCAQCKQIDAETVYNCRWLHFSFCCLPCLKRFQAKIAIVCDLCKNHLNFSRIHVRDDVPNDKTFVFICDQCFDRRKPFAVHCHCCSEVCYKGFGAHNLTVSGLISKFLCSTDCKRESRKVERFTACSECGIQGDCDPVLHDGQDYVICSSTRCSENFQQSHQIKIDNCHKCSTKFANNVKHEHVIIDAGSRKSFCCAKCVYAHVREDTKMVVCCICQHRMQFYNCIRRKCDNRCFCSVNCTIAAETEIEQLMQNDERCHLEYLSLKCTTFDSDSECEMNDSFEDCVSYDESITTMDPVTDNSDSGAVFDNGTEEEETVSIQYEITPELIQRLTTAPELQPHDYASKCYRCEIDIKSAPSTVQWEILKFCTNFCYESFIRSKNYSCAMCPNDYDQYCNVVCTYVVGNRLYLFCSERCAKSFFSLMVFCKFCRSIIDPTNSSREFCLEDCRTRYDQLYTEAEVKLKECKFCQLVKEENISLLFADLVFNFCSFPCYFHQTLSCNLFPEQCTICQIYFVRNQCEPSYILHHNNELKGFCSQLCQSHYKYKYQSLEMCTICQRQKSNFNMIKTVVTGTPIKLNYCSVQCIQVIEESSVMKQAYESLQPKQ